MNEDSNPSCSPEAVMYDLICCAEGVRAPMQLQQGNRSGDFSLNPVKNKSLTDRRTAIYRDTVIPTKQKCGTETDEN